jgi:hyperosmotically inducible protein
MRPEAKMRTRSLLTLSLMSLLAATVPLSLGADKKDSAVESRAKGKLAEAKLGLDLSVDDGTARLEGVVESIAQKEKVERMIAKIDGISRVTNNLRIVPDLDRERVVRAAARKIRMYPYYSIFDNVELETREGVLTLKGEVTQPWYKADIERLMASVPGVQAIENKLEVLPLSPMDDQIRMRVARAIYGNPTLSRYGIQANPPIHVVVKNGNVTLTGGVATTLEKALAERAARFAATYFGLDNRLLVESEIRRAGA